MILVIDFGSQYTQLLARRVREMRVSAEIVPFTKAQAAVEGHAKSGTLKGIILSGGPRSVYEDGAPTFATKYLYTGIPVLGVCYGFQLINHLLGGKVVAGEVREYGTETLRKTVQPSGPHPLKSLEKEFKVWMSHGDECTTLGGDLVCDAVSTNNIVASFHHKSLPIYGIQFHPEVSHTENGNEVIREFIFSVCGATADWDISNLAHRLVDGIKTQVNAVSESSKVICALSGGVDSTVAAVLTSRAVGKRLHCLFIDTGLMRKGECEQVMTNFKELDLNVEMINASELFLGRLKGVSDPETKRKIIGNTFIEVFESASANIPDADFLVQGTLYTDVIESVPLRGTSVTIKTHHNVGGLPEKMKFKLVEPLRELFKDEVRSLGRELGLHDKFLARHPFPGPGLAIRILGEVTPEKVRTLQAADAILIDELHSAALYNSVWQAFAVLLPVQSVGVMGDSRTYQNACVLRCVDATDGMTASWSKLPFEFLERVSTRITNEVRGINRVTLDITSKPPATIEWE